MRGPVKNEKQELLPRDVDSFNIDLCYLQETKIKGIYINIGVRRSKLIVLKTINIKEMVLSFIPNGRIISVNVRQTIIVYTSDNDIGKIISSILSFPVNF